MKKKIVFIILIPSIILNYFTLSYIDADKDLSLFSTTVILIFNSCNIFVAISYFYLGFKKSIYLSIYLFFIFFIGDFAMEKFVNRSNTLKLDKELGWILKKDLNFNIQQETAENKTYSIEYSSSNVEGFREFGNINSNKEKVFLLGDSFTNGPFASNDKMYYKYIKEILSENGINTEWFVAGAGGYGTLQQLIILKNYVNIIQPSIFILQFCTNDFENNSYELEKKQIIRSQKFQRPYIVDGKVYVDNSVSAKIYRFLSANSYIFNKLDLIFTNFQYRKFNSYYFLEPSEKEKKSAYLMTEKLLNELFEILDKKVKVFSINCSDGYPEVDEDNKRTAFWAKIMKNHNAYPLLKPNEDLRNLQNMNYDVWHRDRGHLNELGNEMYGKSIANEILKKLNL